MDMPFLGIHSWSSDDISHTCQPREKVSRDKMAGRRAKRDGLRKGAPGVLP